MNKLIARPRYLEQLIGFRDKQVIKVITGIRRCGKSTLLDLYETYLRENGVEDGQIIRINLEYPEYHAIQTHTHLYEHIKERLRTDCMNYIFIDEVQMIPAFQKAVDGLFVRKNCDVCITGSNAHILSGELATLLSGRYVEIKMLPLSFKEYISARGGRTDLAVKYRDYLENSSFPYTLTLSDKKDIRAYLGGVYDSIVLKDIVARRRIGDVGQLGDVIRFTFDNIGNLMSSTKIANTMISGGRKISVHTVEKYLDALTESFILYRAERYDVKGRQRLVTGYKYYLSDLGLRYYLLGGRGADAGRVLENIVYLELLRRGCAVCVGKVGPAEVDFVAAGRDGETYYQVAYTAAGGEGKDGKTTLERELASLDAIKDHNPKYLLTMDFLPAASHNGIRQINVLDWLLE
ncbi:MAG: ATP-binding protein [Clostridiales Family XIII bacterium]|nr:ATP-binding protein [Clostridiales Family XIII bacterium]